MSRGQEQAVIDTSKKEGGTQFGDSQNSYKSAVQDIGAYRDQLSKYAAGNPYVQGGEYESAENRVLANTADAGATAAGAALQTQALRTGQNPYGAQATQEAIADRNTRNLSVDQARATGQRIGSEADYNRGTLAATAVPISADTGLAEGQGRLAEGDLGIQQDASKTPGFWDTLGDSFASQLGKTLGGGNFSATKEF